MENYADIDLFTDESLIGDPYSYFEYLRSQGPAVYLPRHNVYAVTGYSNGLPIFSDHEIYSAAIAVNGPIPPLPFTPEGDDITEQLDAVRDELPFAGIIITEDMPQHAKTKSLMMGMITPARLKANHEFMGKLSNRLIDEFVDKGECEVIMDFGQPFATLVIADLLGVPEEDHPKYRVLRSNLPGIIGAQSTEHDPLAEIGLYFWGYIEDRRANPRDDVLGRLAQVKYKDGSTPDILEVVKTATFMFGAGQHTTVLLIASALRALAEDQAMQKQLREDRSLIPNFVEEMLRLNSPVKLEYRLVKKTTEIGGVEVKAGSTLLLILSAMNRDPEIFEDPQQVRLDRKNGMDHVAFGRGMHACAGSPLARAEATVALNSLFDRTANFTLDEEKHGPAGERRFEYEPTYTLRGLKELHLKFTPA